MTNAVNIAQGGSNNVTFRNRIINGAMVIDQRNAGALISGSSSAYCVDRWYYLQDSTNWTIQQSSTVPSGQGFVNSVVMTTTGTKTLSSSTYAGILQQVEGYNIADLGWGSSSAQPVTLSFWVRSSKTGIYTATLKNSSAGASYAAEYTISTANTWQKVTITVAGPTIGTWLTTNGIGVQVTFWLCGQNTQGAPNTWTATNINMSTNQVNWFDTNGATFYITGVQLEAGTTASPFEYRQYGTEFALCQRYFETNYPIGQVVGTSQAYGYSRVSGTQVFSSNSYGTLMLQVQKRTNPTVTYYNPSGSAGTWNGYTSGTGPNTVTISDNNSTSYNLGFSFSSTSQNFLQGFFAVSAEL